MLRRGCLLFVLTLAPGMTGCVSSVSEERIEVSPANDPLFLPRSVLEQYARGQALGSEVTSFPKMIEDVRRVDPERAEILDQGLQQIQEASPATRAAKAKELLEQLQPSPG
jgi:hypothetical protein